MKLIITLIVAAFVVISAMMTGSFPLGLAGSIDIKRQPVIFWSMIALVLLFALGLGFVFEVG